MNPKRTARRNRGFTLVELLVVIAIIGILAVVAVGQYQRSIVKAKEATLRENLFVMRSQIHNYFADKGEYPYDLETLVEERYLYKIPVDPITRSKDTWVVQYSDAADEEDISQEQGIEDVRSGAEGSSMDGSPYAGW